MISRLLAGLRRTREVPPPPHPTPAEREMSPAGARIVAEILARIDAAEAAVRAVAPSSADVVFTCWGIQHRSNPFREGSRPLTNREVVDLQARPYINITITFNERDTPGGDRGGDLS